MTRLISWLRFVLAAVASVAAHQLSAAAYTNTAGEVIVGEVAGVTNRLATFRVGGGMVKTVALQHFSSAERERVLLAAGQKIPLPAELDRRLAYLRDLSVRAGRLKLAGKLAAEQADARQKELRTLWKRGLDEACARGQLSENARGQWIGALGE